MVAAADALPEFEAWLHVAEKLNGRFTLPFQEYEAFAARMAGDKDREVTALRKSCAVYRKLIKLFKLDPVAPEFSHVGKSEVLRFESEAENLIAQIKALHPRFARKESHLLIRARNRYGSKSDE